jgi:hypothetical protein
MRTSASTKNRPHASIGPSPAHHARNQPAPHGAESQAPAHLLLHAGDGVLIEPGPVVQDDAARRLRKLRRWRVIASPLVSATADVALRVDGGTIKRAV